jgi:GNAT superfamily N-acetyltransferase/ketosteroid isomerase-like protein
VTEERAETGAHIAYVVSPTMGDDALNALFSASWLEHQWTAFQPILCRSLAYICAFCGDALIGFVNLAWDGSIHAFLLDTTVHPAWRRRGVGRELVRQAAAVAREQGMHWLHVDYEPQWAAFYQECGFTPTLAGLIRLNQATTTGADAANWKGGKQMESSPNEREQAQRLEVVIALNDALNRRDVGAMMTCFADECVFENTYPPPDGARYEGQAQVRAFWEEFFGASTHAHIATEELFACGDRCVMLWRYEWRNAQGEAGHMRGVDVYAFQGSLISQKLSYVKG